MSANTGQFKKGEHRSPTTEFKAGHETWNKGREYVEIQGDKHPNWKGGKPDCLDCGKKLKGYTQVRCIDCHLKSDKAKAHLKEVHADRKGQPSPRKGVTLSDETKAKISANRKGIGKGIRGPHGHPAWNRIGDGITPKNKLERAEFRRQIVPSVLKRDDYTCQICEQKGGYLHVDHIKKWAEYPELRYDLNNCRTVCRACHYYITFKRKLPSTSTWGLVNIVERVG